MSEYIEREATLWHKRVMIGSDWSGEYSAEAVLVEDINKLPAADVAEVVHGRWIDSPNIPECVVCSNCMSDGLSAQVLAPAPVHYRFCPCCGARMDGEEINGT